MPGDVIVPGDVITLGDGEDSIPLMIKINNEREEPATYFIQWKREGHGMPMHDGMEGDHA